MEHKASIPEHGALLVVEIGADRTRATLVDLVDQSYRLIAQAATPSTWEAPCNDPLVAIRAALRQIETTTGRELLRGDDLITPQNEAGNGVDGVVITTGATGTMPVAVAGLARQGSVRSATHAARSTATHLVDTLALDDRSQPLGAHLLALNEGKPDVIIIAGGHEHGPTTAGRRLADLIGLYARHTTNKPLVIFAGNSDAAEQVRERLGEAASVEVTDNLLPEPNRPRLEPTRAYLRRVYRERYTTQLPGAERLTSLSGQRLGNTIEDQSLIVRFLAERYGRNVLAITADTTMTACLLMSAGRYSEAVFGRLGTRLGALQVLREAGAENIARWLPFAIDAGALENRLLNRALRPRQAPTDLDDLLLDYALLREAVSHAYRALRDERPEAAIDLVIAGGLFADAPRPGLAALALLDALQPTSDDSDLAISLYLDQFDLLPAAGALAHLNTDAAACLVEQDALNNLPLATVIVPRGDLGHGRQVAEVELTILGGETITRAVKGGDIARLPLPRGKRGTLRIRPAGGIAIGQNRPGYEVVSDEAAITGSALGVIIDARPRPLALPGDLEQRRDMLVRWMDALGALPSTAAFATTPADEPANGRAGPDEPSPEPVAGTADDVTALRAGLLEQPRPRRSLFRRR